MKKAREPPERGAAESLKKNRKIAVALAAQRLGIGANAITQSIKIIPFIAFAVKPKHRQISRFWTCSNY